MNKILEKIPKEFTINHINFIVEKPKSIDEDNEKSFGYFSEARQLIRIASNMRREGCFEPITEEQKFYTFLHELGHCYACHTGIDDTEVQAQMFANFLYDFIKTVKYETDEE